MKLGDPTLVLVVFLLTPHVLGQSRSVIVVLHWFYCSIHKLMIACYRPGWMMPTGCQAWYSASFVSCFSNSALKLFTYSFSVTGSAMTRECPSESKGVDLEMHLVHFGLLKSEARQHPASSHFQDKLFQFALGPCDPLVQNIESQSLYFTDFVGAKSQVDFMKHVSFLFF